MRFLPRCPGGLGCLLFIAALAAPAAFLRAQNAETGAAKSDLAAVTASSAAADASSTAVENSVVKVFSSMRSPDLSKPWAKQSRRAISGTGIVIEGKRILTNAHVVTYASQVTGAGEPGRRQNLRHGRGDRAGH